MEEALDDPSRTADGAENRASGRRRVRLADLRREPGSPGKVRAAAVLETREGILHEACAELPEHEGSYVRAACRATLAALRDVLGGDVELELIGVRTVELGDSEVVLVQIAARSEGRPRLLQGVAVTSASPDLDAARAVLHATNRLVERVLRG